MPDDDSMLAQGTVDMRNEERAAAWGRTTQPPSDTVCAILTERQARALVNLVEIDRRAGLAISIQHAAALSEPEMADLELRLRRALGEKP